MAPLLCGLLCGAIPGSLQFSFASSCLPSVANTGRSKESMKGEKIYSFLVLPVPISVTQETALHANHSSDLCTVIISLLRYFHLLPHRQHQGLQCMDPPLSYWGTTINRTSHSSLGLGFCYGKLLFQDVWFQGSQCQSFISPSISFSKKYF